MAESYKSSELLILDSVLVSLTELIKENFEFNKGIESLKTDTTWTENEKLLLNTFHEGLDSKCSYNSLELLKNSIFQLKTIYIQREIISRHENILRMIDYKDNFSLTSCVFKKLSEEKISQIQIRNFCIMCDGERDSVIEETSCCPYYNSLDNDSKCKCPRDVAYSLCSMCFYKRTSSQLNYSLSNVTESPNELHTCLVKCNSCGLWICPFYIERVAINDSFRSILNGSGNKKQDRVCGLCKTPGHTKVTCYLNLPREVKQ